MLRRRSSCLIGLGKKTNWHKDTTGKSWSHHHVWVLTWHWRLFCFFWSSVTFPRRQSLGFGFCLFPFQVNQRFIIWTVITASCQMTDTDLKPVTLWRKEEKNEWNCLFLTEDQLNLAATSSLPRCSAWRYSLFLCVSLHWFLLGDQLFQGHVVLRAAVWGSINLLKSKTCGNKWMPPTAVRSKWLLTFRGFFFLFCCLAFSRTLSLFGRIWLKEGDQWFIVWVVTWYLCVSD